MARREVLSVEVEQKRCAVAVQFVDDERVVVRCGEMRRIGKALGNQDCVTGSAPQRFISIG
jgi:hypothetical protein